MLEALEKLTAELNTMKTSFGDLTRQVTSQQFFAEEKIRTDGSSGIIQVLLKPTFCCFYNQLRARIQ